MRERDDSAKGLAARMRIVAESFTNPASTPFPGLTERGTDSPVRAEVSIRDVPEITSPSRGTRSPGRTSTSAPTFTLSGGTSDARPRSSIIRAESGRRSMSDAMERRERPTARSCTYSPTA